MSHENLPPGFRFHPTDEELIMYYLHRKLSDFGFSPKAIADVDLNRCEPWDLPGKAKMGEKEWYFFSLRDRKYPTGLRTNRATESGYWKTTGKDKEIFLNETQVGMKKTLVFYKGRAPRGEKSNWVMHEYRHHTEYTCKPTKEEWIVCRVFKKSSNCKKQQPTPLESSQAAAPSMDPAFLASSTGDLGDIDMSSVLNHLLSTPTNSLVTSAPAMSTNNIMSNGVVDTSISVNVSKADMGTCMGWGLGKDADNSQQNPLLSWPHGLLGTNASSMLRALQLNNALTQPIGAVCTGASPGTGAVDLKLNVPSSSPDGGGDSYQKLQFGEFLWRNC